MLRGQDGIITASNQIHYTGHAVHCHRAVCRILRLFIRPFFRTFSITLEACWRNKTTETKDLLARSSRRRKITTDSWKKRTWSSMKSCHDQASPHAPSAHCCALLLRALLCGGMPCRKIAAGIRGAGFSARGGTLAPPPQHDLGGGRATPFFLRACCSIFHCFFFLTAARGFQRFGKSRPMNSGLPAG